MLVEQDFIDRKFKLWKQDGEAKNSLIDNDVYIAKGVRTFGDSKRTNLIVLTHLPSVNEVYVSNTYTQPLFNREYFLVGRAIDTTELDDLLSNLKYELEELEDLSLKTLTKYGEGRK